MADEQERRLGRNEPCPCGSGKKFKYCHGELRRPYPRPVPEELLWALEEHEANELRREHQQGLGRPIVAGEMNGYQMVAVGPALTWGKWKTFIDFLGNYIKNVLGPAWGNAEIAKPLSERHPILQWYDAVCRAQQASIVEPGKIHTTESTGAVAAYYGLAYNLYLLAHNVKLQEKLLERLKKPDQFRGAYYETLVAAWLILAGFELTLQNESDPTATHCEFTARSKASGKAYSVEAKARAPYKSHLDVGNQLADALRKSVAHKRIVLIDVNVPDDPNRTADVWLNELMRSLKGREPKLTIKGQPAPPAFVLVTNHPYHYNLDGTNTPIAVIADGFKIPDFGPTVRYQGLIAAFKAKQKYADIFNLVKAIGNYRIPTTFDGDVPEFSFGEAERKWKIGERYHFPDVDGGVTGILATAVVVESEKAAKLSINADDGRGIIVTAPLSDAELRAFHSHPETFFGVHVPVGENLKSPLDMFEWLHETHLKTPRVKLLEFFKNSSDLAELSKLQDDELLLVWCERNVAGFLALTQKRSASQEADTGTPE